MTTAAIKTIVEQVPADGYTVFHEAMGLEPQMIEKVTYQVIKGKYIAGGDVIVGVYDNIIDAQAKLIAVGN
jgi:hypothetical protein